ncbi:hypothetical protein TWF696_002593 [Orbilia brochopaga]|uniref:Ubiquitin-like-conjugating enzyme ATG10 n=1 Tax=Orbilia brochopaga TaxID=3140254 RepID=A0AAV9U3Z0_9PEZI
MTDTDEESLALALPFLSKETFAAAIAGLVAQLDAYAADLRYSIKHSPFDPSDIYLELTRSTPLAVSPTPTPAIDEISAPPDEDDPESLASEYASTPQLTVHYYIILSPIYSLPTLYFTTTPPIALPSLYDLLVPPDQRAAVAAVGVQGAISQTEHPYLQRTCWFVHPCRTADAMAPWVAKDEDGEGGGRVGVEGYLGVWLGIVGRAVGLTVPLRRV